MKNLTIVDKEYEAWVDDLVTHYRSCQIKAAIRVNEEQLRFNWLLGHDICEMNVESRWGEGVLAQLSKDLRERMPQVDGLSVTNLRYCRRFYQLYSKTPSIRPQVEGELRGKASRQIRPQAGGEFDNAADQSSKRMIFMVPWGHHKLILDKVKGDVDKALFYVGQVLENNWSRALLLNWIDTNLYERSGKAVSNFHSSLPDSTGDLAQELTRDPYDFAFAGVTERYNEKQLKEALVKNIERFLLELGAGFAYMGREYRLEVGETEQFMDMLFYNVNLHCYVVVEVKTVRFTAAHIGQLGSYMVAVDHQLRKKDDNKTIGLLICKSKDRIEAQYALEATTQPIAVSEYDLEKFYPEKLEGTIPTIAEIEAQLEKSLEGFTPKALASLPAHRKSASTKRPSTKTSKKRGGKKEERA